MNVDSGRQPRIHSEPSIISANAGDHTLIHELLRAVQRAPSSGDFSSWLDEPSYEPSDRLLIKSNGRVVAHVQMLPRTAWFGGVQMPIAGVLDLACLPEFQEAGFADGLLAMAEQSMQQNGAVLALTRTCRPKLFASHGWLYPRSQGYSEANTREILAQLARRKRSPGRRTKPTDVRLWRHVELDSLRRTYSKAALHLWGAIHRSEDYWHWLIGRKVHDEIIVCTRGNKSAMQDSGAAAIVGFAMTRGSRILELCYLPNWPVAGRRLLARACQDAIEHDHHNISLHFPKDDPLHQHLLGAGGMWHPEGEGNGQCLMIKLLDPKRWVAALSAEYQQRASSIGLTSGYHVAMDVDGERWQWSLADHGAALTERDSPDAAIRCRDDTFQALLLGNLDADAAWRSGDLDGATLPTVRSLSTLFAVQSFSPSAFDLVRF